MHVHNYRSVWLVSEGRKKYQNILNLRLCAKNQLFEMEHSHYGEYHFCPSVFNQIRHSSPQLLKHQSAISDAFFTLKINPKSVL